MEKKTVLKQCLGIDCGKEELVCSLALMDSDYDVHVAGTLSVKNLPEGFKKLEKWLLKQKVNLLDLGFVMEATGVYHEKIALHLHSAGAKVMVILPNKAKAFAQTLTTKTVNDKTSSVSLAIMGLEKKLDP